MLLTETLLTIASEGNVFVCGLLFVVFFVRFFCQILSAFTGKCTYFLKELQSKSLSQNTSPDDDAPHVTGAVSFKSTLVFLEIIFRYYCHRCETMIGMISSRHQVLLSVPLFFTAAIMHWYLTVIQGEDILTVAENGPESFLDLKRLNKTIITTICQKGQVECVEQDNWIISSQCFYF